ncbi:hypothetical protein KR222_001636 [Zaprionus bogoriensis]|nr:hypothetical protein KR222_001636 [Zaprionus bogoriensis]
MQWQCKQLLVTVLVLLLEQQAFGQNATNTTDYCQAGLCPYLKKHIACKNSGVSIGNRMGSHSAQLIPLYSAQELGRACPANAKLLNITMHQAVILNHHNNLRNLLASGKVDNLPQPDKMATMQWSDELELLATLNVKQCALLYDPCHNTPDYRNSGQSLALQNVSIAVEVPDEDMIKNNIDRWWDQRKNVTREQIENFPKEPKRIELIRNFALIARDNNTHVGCAAMRYTKGPLDYFLLACNYASNFVAEYPVYRIKSLNCQNGVDRSYTSLCKAGEQYRDVEPLEPQKWPKQGK